MTIFLPENPADISDVINCGKSDFPDLHRQFRSPNVRCISWQAERTHGGITIDPPRTWKGKGAATTGICPATRAECIYSCEGARATRK